jgi:hypothetical protein
MLLLWCNDLLGNTYLNKISTHPPKWVCALSGGSVVLCHCIVVPGFCLVCSFTGHCWVVFLTLGMAGASSYLGGAFGGSVCGSDDNLE